jgi:putative GTP pyrophosphokinase
MESDVSLTGADWRACLLIYKFALDEVQTKLNILNEEFMVIHKRSPIEHIKSRVKTVESITEKLTRRGYDVSIENAEEYLNDIAGIRVVCSFYSDIYTIYDLLRKQSDIHIIEVKDYIKNPKTNGYRSLHLIIEIPVYLSYGLRRVRVEVQIRTIAMDFWASLEHKIYYKFNKSIPSEIIGELKECADMVNYLDDRLLRINEKVNQFK